MLKKLSLILQRNKQPILQTLPKIHHINED